MDNPREKLTKVLKKCGVWNASKTIDDIADYLIANDVMPIVRCNDCKHRTDGLCPMDIIEDYPWVATKDDDFCFYGESEDNERKTD